MPLLKSPRATDLRQSFVDHLGHAWPPEKWIDLPIVVAVSGGSDSVALLLGLSSLRDRFLKSPDATRNSSSAFARGKLIVGHFHHGLRGSDADHDAAFVKSLCEQQGIVCEMGEINV